MCAVHSSATSHPQLLLPRCFSAALNLVFPILLSGYQINREQKLFPPPSQPLIVSRRCCISHIVSLCYSQHYFRDRNVGLDALSHAFLLWRRGRAMESVPFTVTSSLQGHTKKQSQLRGAHLQLVEFPMTLNVTVMVGLGR